MPKLSLFRPQFMGRTLANRQRRAARVLQRAWRRRPRKGRLFRKARAGGGPMIVPLRCGYQYQLIGSGSSVVPLDAQVGLADLPAAWFARYSSIFQEIKINKVRIVIQCNYNIGQHGVGTQSLYQIWSKRATTTAESPPNDITEWMNLQNSTKKVFRGAQNSVSYYFTPRFEEVAQPLNVPVTQLKNVRARWMTMPTASAQCVPHIGLIAHIMRGDGSVIDNTNVFTVSVTLYTQCKGILQL